MAAIMNEAAGRATTYASTSLSMSRGRCGRRLEGPANGPENVSAGTAPSGGFAGAARPVSSCPRTCGGGPYSLEETRERRARQMIGETLPDPVREIDRYLIRDD